MVSGVLNLVLRHVENADAFILRQFAQHHVIFSPFAHPFGMAITEVSVAAVGAVVVALIGIVVVEILGVKFVMAIKGQPGAAGAGNDVFEAEAFVRIMFARADAGFGFASLIEADTGSAAGRFVAIACLGGTFIAPPGKILVTVAIRGAFIESKALEIEEFAVGGLVGPHVIGSARTHEEI